MVIDDREKVANGTMLDYYRKHFLNSLTLGARLQFGDYMFVSGDDELIGVERKTIGDLLRVIADKRFVSEQLMGFMQFYDLKYLLVEGPFKPGPAGELLLRSGKGWENPTWGRRHGWTYAEVARWLISVTEGTGLRYQRTVTPFETITWLHNLEIEASKPRADRRALAGIYETPLPASLVPPSDTRKLAALLPGVGVDKSAKVADHFGSRQAMAEAAVVDWEKVPGIGKTLARRIHAWFHDRK